ncbi:non-ribosomal peptide synthetase [Amycolatopsis sp. cmx-11-12]|uniref:non-ribosomal peptide synthetase n=1 Tax=Amycolatopsis sp. cmx-11-12 TaxID=2785795 RepID=UPI0039170F93
MIKQSSVETHSTVCRVPAQVARYAAERPEATAVLAADGTLDFAVLVDQAARIAGALVARGAGPETPVGVLVGRGRDLVPCLLAVWWIGAVYVPLDDRDPADRLNYLIRQADVALLLADEVRSDLDVTPSSVVRLADARRFTEPVDHPVEPHPAARAYIVFTSGTTGRPKGVEITYGGLEAFTSALLTLDLPVGGLGVNPVSPFFDGWLWCTLLCLLYGQGVALVDLTDDDGMGVGDRLAGIGPRTISLTPSILAACEVDLPTVEVLVLAGEATGPRLVRRWSAGRRVLNVYGPTEATIAATWADTARGDDPATTIGRALPGYTVHVLDSELRRVPDGTVGEIHIGGPAVARGYRGQPGATAVAFVPDPFGAPGGRIYRTGDLAKTSPDGTLEFLGRKDDQLKVRGFRIEPGEIETVIGAVPGVSACAVFPLASGSALGAAVAATGEVAGLVRQHCADVLPAHMRPAEIVVLDSLPFTSNGKVDRRALADLASAARATAGRAPGTTREQEVLDVWSRFFSSEVTDVERDFFELGGHSLMAARVVSALRATSGLRLTVGDLFAGPTPAQVAARLDELAAAEAQPTGAVR